MVSEPSLLDLAEDQQGCATQPAKPLANPYEGWSYEALKARRRDILNTRTGHMREVERLLAEAQRVGRAMRAAPRDSIAISDHAVIRWLERAHGFDTDAVRREILDHISAHDPCGDGVVLEGNGLRVVMIENRVTTVLPSGPDSRVAQGSNSEQGPTLDGADPKIPPPNETP